jgi:hypothetical protein
LNVVGVRKYPPPEIYWCACHKVSLLLHAAVRIKSGVG